MQNCSNKFPFRLVSDIKYGTGHGLSKSEAKERAARETLDIINRQHIAVWSIEYFKWATENRPPAQAQYPVEGPGPGPQGL